MKHLFTCACLVGGLAAYSQSEAFKKEAEAKFLAFAEDYPGVSLTVYSGDTIYWEKQTGFADLESGRPTQPATLFNIYSTSKYLLGMCYLKLHLSGELPDLSIPIRSLDPNLPAAYEKITLKQLLNHTSGIRHYQGKKDWMTFASLNPKTPNEALSHFSSDPLKSIPGEELTYTTFGIVLASHLLEVITKLDFETAVEKQLNIPFVLDDIEARKATGYIRSGKKWKPIPNLNARAKFGGGGLLGSSRQLAKAGTLLYNNQLAPLNQVKEAFKAHYSTEKTEGHAFATGSGIAKAFQGKEDVLYVAMGGGSPGGRSYLLVFADFNLSIALTANQEGDGSKAYALCRAIFDLILESQ